MPLWIGTSGWQYRHWRGRLYPAALPAGRWFDRYLEAFDTVELNVTFYMQPKPAVFDGWARRVPDGFLYAVKASRFLTHVRRLVQPRDSVDLLMDGASRLGTHLGPILIQLPPDLEAVPDRLAETLDAFPRGVRIAFEPRHRSWLSDEVFALLEAHGAALCWADRRGPLQPARATADWGYLRFHGGRGSPRGCYTDAGLQRWVEPMRSAWPATADVFAYFNNDFHGCAPRDAAIFAALARHGGRSPTRTPPLDEVPVG